MMPTFATAFPSSAPCSPLPRIRRAQSARPVCVECQGTSAPLYEMNGRRYCASCLHTWCLSLPEVQADLRAQAQWEG